MAIGIGIGLPFRKLLLKYPTTNLVGRYVQVSEGTDLINAKGGVSIPYISGSGLDQIFDFSVLGDVRLNKSNTTYWGSSINSWFYYNVSNPYHFKLKDFHYRYLEDQLINTTNRYFAKITYVNEVLLSVDELLIYSTEQIGESLLNIKSYIGILQDFYGDNILVNGSFSVDSNWAKGSGWSISSGNAKRTNTGVSSNLTQQNAITSAMYNKVFLTIFDATITTGGVDARFGFKTASYKTVSGTYSFEIASSTSPDYLLQGSADFSGSVDNAQLRYLYINYYNKEKNSTNPIIKPV